MDPAAPPPAAPRPRRFRRLRRAAIVLLAVLAVAYAALWIVRLTRDLVPRAPRAALAGGPLVIAHRGASAVVAEHTLAAYRRALADGADVLELDVRLTSDGAVVVTHDRDLGRALAVERVVAEHDLAELRAAVAARHPGAAPAELLPTLDEVIAQFPAARLNVELKDEAPALVTAVAAAIERAGRQDAVVVASFHGDALDRFRAATGGRVATAAGPGEGARFFLCYVLDVPCRPAFDVLQIPPRLRARFPSLRLDDAAFIDFAHRHGLAVHYWTIDDEPTMRALLGRGADGVITNRPAAAVSVRTERTR